ncbi:MAG: hypothetical protein ACOC3J_02255, partial [Gemmatimonadota bacterium]
HARAGVELVAEHDQYKLLYRLEDLARVHAVLGNSSEAAARLQKLLREPGYVTPNLLRLDPRLRPLVRADAADGPEAVSRTRPPGGAWR